MNIKIDEFQKMIEECKKLNKEFITLKTSAIESLVNSNIENNKKISALLVQMYSLISALKDKGVSEKEVRKILSLKK